MHHWSGMCDNLYTNKQLADIINNDITQTPAKTRILNIDVLFTDEISMISAKVFFPTWLPV